jgi:hypothetical protein
MPAEPFVFVDRSLGRIMVPRLLRADGISLVEHKARCFCLANGNLRAEAMAELYVAH